MEIDKLKKLLNKFDSKTIYNAELKKKNWFNIGGKAKVFFKVIGFKIWGDFLKF